MFETQLTVVGKLVTGVDRRRIADGSVVANFRVVSTQRRFDRAGGTWSDGDKLFLDVTCWRRLAENTFATLVKGDNVVVTGRLYTREFEHEGRRRSTVTLEAQSVAPDLSWCTAALTRTGRRAGESPDADTSTDDHRDTEHRDTEHRDTGAASSAVVEGSRGREDMPRLVGAVPGGEG